MKALFLVFYNILFTTIYNCSFELRARSQARKTAIAIYCKSGKEQTSSSFIDLHYDTLPRTISLFVHSF